MPKLIGRSYLEVHNELSRLRLKIKLENEWYPDKMHGTILSQSIPPGKPVEVGSKLFLKVNISENQINIPKLVGQHLDNAKAILKNVVSTSGGPPVSLEIGGITYIPADANHQADKVISQIPEPGKISSTKEKVFLLVTEPAVKKKGEAENQSYNGQVFPVVAKALNLRAKKWKLRTVVKTENIDENAKIKAYEEKDGIYYFDVFFYTSSKKTESGFELLSIKSPETGKLNVELETLSLEKKYEKNILEKMSDSLSNLFSKKKEKPEGEEVPEIIEPKADEDKNSKEEPEIVNKNIDELLSQTDFNKDESLNLIFYRVGEVELRVLNQDKKVLFKEAFKSDI